jgi:hypothetical protein
VLEVDPDNETARRQVGQVAAAVRHFDKDAPRRRWLAKAHRRGRLGRWASSLRDRDGGVWGNLVWILLVLAALFLAFTVGRQVERSVARNTATAGQ